jgi:hypothetical protein
MISGCTFDWRWVYLPVAQVGESAWNEFAMLLALPCWRTSLGTPQNCGATVLEMAHWMDDCNRGHLRFAPGLPPDGAKWRHGLERVGYTARASASQCHIVSKKHVEGALPGSSAAGQEERVIAQSLG